MLALNGLKDDDHLGRLHSALAALRGSAAVVHGSVFSRRYGLQRHPPTSGRRSGRLGRGLVHRPAGRRRCWRPQSRKPSVAPVARQSSWPGPAVGELCVVLPRVAQQHRTALHPPAAHRRWPWLPPWRDACQRGAHALFGGHRCGDIGQGLQPSCARRHGHAVRDGHEPSRRSRRQCAEPAHHALGRLTQTLGEQRVVLTQEGADDQQRGRAWTTRQSAGPASAHLRRVLKSAWRRR